MSASRRAITIRPGEPGDVEALVAIEAASFPEAERATRRAFRHAAGSPTMSLILASEPDGPAPCGYAILERRRGSTLARLTSIAIAPDRAGRGSGGALLAAVEAEALRHGATRLRLEVRADNEPARRLYERAGYRRFAVVEDYYDDGEAAWRYEKALSPA